MGHIQIVNEKFRDEYLNLNVFLSLYDARKTVETWWQDIAATAQLIGLITCNPLGTSNLQMIDAVG